MQFAKDLAADHGCSGFAFETDAKGRNTLWEARHNLAYAFVHGSKGKKIMVTDVCVPLSELAGAITYAREQIEAAGVEGGLLGHVGDGNFHALLLVDPTNQDDLDRAERVNANLVDYALRCGGTCTGEHGVGVGKLKYLRREHGEALDLMRQVKQLFDPHNILNPGKKLPID